MYDELIEKIKDKMLKTAKALIQGRLFLPEDFDQIALEAWQRMIHEIFLDICPCQTKAEGVCLQEYEPQDLVEIPGIEVFQPSVIHWSGSKTITQPKPV